jgi:hypothetical protein
MGLFKRTTEESIDPSWARVNGLVIKADAPPQGAPRFGPHSHGTIVVLADVPMHGQRQLSGTFRYAEEHWVVPAMDVPIAINPAAIGPAAIGPAAIDSARSDTFVVDWQAVPSMQQQVASNHPALADPFVASRRIAAAIGITPSEKTASQSERFQAAAAAAATKPAPAGRVRGVAMTVSVRGHYYASGSGGGDGDGGSTGSGVGLTESSAAVLSVAVPGRAPYAVYVPKFKIPRKRISIPGEAMPVLVSATDPGEVEIVWDEMPGLGDQIAAKMADSMRSNSQLAAGLAAQFQAAQAQAMANYPPPPPGTAATPAAYPPAAYPAGIPGAQIPGFTPAGLPPQARQMLVDNLKRSLLYVTDPAQRQLVLNQYRAMGIEVTPEELGF